MKPVDVIISSVNTETTVDVSSITRLQSALTLAE